MKLRVILLEKIASITKDCYTRHTMMPAEHQGPWIILGHFDAMYTYCFDTADSNVFQEVYQSNQIIASYNSGQSYFHPLYLLSEEDDESFWKTDSWCMAVVRVHYAFSAHIASLHTSLKELLPKDAQSYNCTCHIYPAMELCDLIVAIKSDKISSILNFALRLRKYSCVGKVYTYCGISYPLIQDLSQSPNSDDIIPSAAIRFSVSNIEKAQKQMRHVKRILELRDNDIYSIVGVDDISLTCPGLPFQRLVEFCRTYFVEKYDEVEALSTAFSDVITRTGIHLDKLSPVLVYDKDGISSRQKLIDTCQRLVDIDQSIQEIVHNEEYHIPYESVHSWLKPLSELTKTLLRMSRTVVLDEFVYLMLSGASAFLRHIKVELEQHASLPTEKAEYFQRFVQNWSNQMEHVMRIEGQLTHHPETRPIVFDIPVMMLEYTLAFLDEVSTVLLAGDNQKKHINLLLTPSLCNKVNTVELFEFRKGIPGLVLIVVPFYKLYNPASILSELVHEISHFVGEMPRNREFRTECFVKAASVLMAKVVFDNYNPALIRGIEQQFHSIISTRPGGNARMIQQLISEWSKNPYTEESYSTFVLDTLLQNNDAESVPHFVMDLTTIRDIEMPKFRDLLDSLCTLFREIYADICMLYLLPLDTEFYIRSQILELGADERDPYEMFAIRIYVALVASGKEIPEEMQRDEEKWPRLATEIEKIRTGLQQPEEGKDRLFPFSSIQFLIRYAEQCYRSLYGTLGQGNDCDRIKKMFLTTSNGMDYSALLETINAFRIKMVEQEEQY